MFYIGGTKLEKDQSQLLGNVLQRLSIDLSEKGVDIQKLIDGKSDLVYEELEYLLGNYTSSKNLSENLRDKLTSRKFNNYS